MNFSTKNAKMLTKYFEICNRPVPYLNNVGKLQVISIINLKVMAK